MTTATLPTTVEDDLIVRATARLLYRPSVVLLDAVDRLDRLQNGDTTPEDEYGYGRSDESWRNAIERAEMELEAVLAEPVRHHATAHAVPEARCPQLDCWSVDCKACGMHETFTVAHGPAAFDDPELQFLQAEVYVHNALGEVA